MRARDNKKRYLCYPEDRAKQNWDIIIALALILACTMTPIFLAFHDPNAIGWWNQFNMTLDIIFAIDIIIVFLSSFYDDEFHLIDELRPIAVNYIRGWFIIDFVAIIPFDIILSGSADSDTE